MADLALLGPTTIGNMTLRNRIMMSPMSQNSASQSGDAGPWHLVHYGSRAVGGCGLILMEDTAVAENGRVSSRSLALYNDSHAQSLKPIVDFCHEQGSKVGIQVAHAGRKAYRDTRGGGIDLVSTCQAPFDARWRTPRMVEKSEIGLLINRFAATARLAASAGFDAIEIHAAHGYLIHQFLSPITNERADEYGGALANRARFLLQVAESVRTQWPEERPLFCRLPASDGHTEGLQRHDVVELAAMLGERGVDVIDVAAGNVSPICATITSEAAKGTAKAVRAETDLPVVVGGATSTEAATRMLQDGICDIVAIGRPLLVDPYWPMSVASACGDRTLVPSQYALAFPANNDQAA
jgi:NADPH2 dehydrogenase